MILRILHTFLLLLLISGCSFGQPETGKKIENYFGTELSVRELNNFLESKMDSLNIPGLSFALVNNGEVVHHKTLGYADAEQKKPVTDQTIFEGASHSKSVFAFFVMTYVEEGKLDLEGLECIFQQRIAQPLGLEHTVFLQAPSTKEHKALPYDENSRRMMPPMDNREFGAAYSIHTESLDFSRWMIALMNRELLAEESYNELFKRHSSVPNDEPDIYYTLGFMTPDIPGLDANMYMHYGNNDGFTAMYILDTEKNWEESLDTIKLIAESE